MRHTVHESPRLIEAGTPRRRAGRWAVHGAVKRPVHSFVAINAMNIARDIIYIVGYF
jgi:hypothetical protein